MKYGLATLLLLCSQQSYGFISQFSCDRVIFSGLTFKKDKQVQVCLNDHGIVYTFGPVGNTSPELDIRVAPSEANWFKYSTNIWDTKMPPGKDIKVKGEGFSIKNGTYRYQLSIGQNGETHHETIKVYHADKRLAKIRLNPNTIYSNIDYYLEDDFDIPRIQHGIW